MESMVNIILQMVECKLERIEEYFLSLVYVVD